MAAYWEVRHLGGTPPQLGIMGGTCEDVCDALLAGPTRLV